MNSTNGSTGDIDTIDIDIYKEEADMKWQNTVVAAVGIVLMASAVHAQTSKSNKTAGIQIVFRSEPDPPKAGENQFEVTVKDKSGKAITDADVSVVFVMPAMPAMKMPAMRKTVKLEAASGGTYRGKGEVPMAGRWDVTVTVSQKGRELAKKKLTLTAR